METTRGSALGTTGEPHPSPEEIRRHLPQYYDLELISLTSMSLVYRAKQDLGNRTIALKVLTPELANDDKFRERFISEVNHQASLRHDNIIDVYSGPKTDDGALYYVAMPLIDGEDLGARLARVHRLDLDETVRIVRAVAAALDHAHSHLLIHRDVKPGNVLIDRLTGRVYLCDFGIAKRLSAESLTQAGTFIGTPGYVAPEGINGQPVDGRADVYALGVVFYECLAGRQPFDQTGSRAKLSAQLNTDPPPLSTLVPGFPRRLDAVVARAMDRNPDNRFATCGEFVAALRSVLGPASPRPVVPPPVGARPGGGPDNVPTPGFANPTVLPGKRPAGPTASPGSSSPPPDRSRYRVAILAVATLAIIGTVIGIVALLGNGEGARSDTSVEPGLLARVPEPLRGNCTQADRAPAGTTARLFCQDGKGARDVRIDLFANQTAMDSSYTKAIRGSGGVERSSGDCGIATGAEHRYPGVGTPDGRVLCYSRAGNTALVWTNDQDRSVATVEGRENDDIDLERAWSSWVELPAFPAPEEQRLLDLVEVGAADCRRPPPSSLDQYREVIAGIECEAPDDESGVRHVSYFRFASVEGLRHSYDGDVSRVQAPNDVYCADADQPVPGFLGNHRYDLRSVEIGGLLCYPTTNDEYVVEWSVEPLRVLGRAIGSDSADVANWWDQYYRPLTATIVEALHQQADPAYPTDEEDELLGHIPSASRTNCIRPPKEQIALNVGDASTVEAAIVCGPTSGAPIVFYYMFEDQSALDASAKLYSGNSGQDCRDAPPPPDFYGYTRYSNGSASGRLICGTNDGKYPFLSWTNDMYDVQGFAFQASDIGLLLDWWATEAGPL